MTLTNKLPAEITSEETSEKKCSRNPITYCGEYNKASNCSMTCTYAHTVIATRLRLDSLILKNGEKK